ncbi:unnamed protein product [Onchocerca flexuosa]|uniref:ATP synthase subunit d, mitochondrial n=1 Tax=Onchocerca flexuosa TaxID=387005 RepID=A0A183I6R9_9BILA|nr:unnamed protein product [Onchocerca flexuosa]
MAIDEAGFTPEFFKDDNVRDLFEGVANVDDVVAPVAITDNKEIEKAMAKVEDIQDVYAAQRANAEVEADIAEFDENALIPSVENSQEKIESKYLELINQLKPIERYAVNFLEAEYKPEFEEEVKEAKAMIDSKKDEWMKAQEDVMEEDGGEQQSDDEISLTYLTGFDVPGSVDEVRSKTSASRLATLRPQLHKSHSRNLRSTTFPASSQQLRSTPGPSKFSAQATLIRRRCESGNFEFVKPVSSAYKAPSFHQSLPGIRIKPTLGDYERPRLCLRKRGESRSGEGESSCTSNTGPESFSESG